MRTENNHNFNPTWSVDILNHHLSMTYHHESSQVHAHDNYFIPSLTAFSVLWGGENSVIFHLNWLIKKSSSSWKIGSTFNFSSSHTFSHNYKGRRKQAKMSSNLWYSPNAQLTEIPGLDSALDIISFIAKMRSHYANEPSDILQSELKLNQTNFRCWLSRSCLVFGLMQRIHRTWQSCVARKFYH